MRDLEGLLFGYHEKYSFLNIWRKTKNKLQFDTLYNKSYKMTNFVTS